MRFMMVVRVMLIYMDIYTTGMHWKRATLLQRDGMYLPMKSGQFSRIL